MKVLKFGGSSVANSKNIKKVLKIVSDASNETKIAVVVSAFGKTTDNLLAGANHALQNIELAKEQLEIIQKLHFEVINELIKTNITEVSEKVSSLFNKVLSIYQGVFYCKNCPPKHWQKFRVLEKNYLLLSLQMPQKNCLMPHIRKVINS